MFGKPRQLETEAELYDVAVRALMRRAHSVHEMKQKLERRSDNKLLVQVVMARLKENGQIDDARYAKQFARQRTESASKENSASRETCERAASRTVTLTRH